MSICIDQPLRFDSNNDFHTTDDLLKAKIEQAIMTKGYAEQHIGEIPWNPQLGSGIYILRHQNMGATEAKTFAKQYISETITKYIPEILNFSLDVEILERSQGKALKITVFWSGKAIVTELNLDIL